jgi:hypothetical protein
MNNSIYATVYATDDSACAVKAFPNVASITLFFLTVYFYGLLELFIAEFIWTIASEQ